MASAVIAENPKTGERVAVPAAHFRKNLEPAGWRATEHEDGTPYDAPAKATERHADAKKDAE